MYLPYETLGHRPSNYYVYAHFVDRLCHHTLHIHVVLDLASHLVYHLLAYYEVSNVIEYFQLLRMNLHANFSSELLCCRHHTIPPTI